MEDGEEDEVLGRVVGPAGRGGRVLEGLKDGLEDADLRDEDGGLLGTAEVLE